MPATGGNGHDRKVVGSEELTVYRWLVLVRQTKMTGFHPYQPSLVTRDPSRIVEELGKWYVVGDTECVDGATSITGPISCS